MKWVIWQGFSSSVESYSRRLAFYITIAEDMKEPHSESVMPLRLQPGARASLKTVSCANLSGPLWGRWKGATEETIGSIWLRLGVCPQPIVWWDAGTSSPTSLQTGLPSRARALILPPRLGMHPRVYPQASLLRFCSRPHTFTGLLLVATGLTR